MDDNVAKTCVQCEHYRNEYKVKYGLFYEAFFCAVDDMILDDEEAKIGIHEYCPQKEEET